MERAKVADRGNGLPNQALGTVRPPCRGKPSDDRSAHLSPLSERRHPAIRSVVPEPARPFALVSLYDRATGPRFVQRLASVELHKLW